MATPITDEKAHLHETENVIGLGCIFADCRIWTERRAERCALTKGSMLDSRSPKGRRIKFFPQVKAIDRSGAGILDQTDNTYVVLFQFAVT
jgi:hypothetical protein